MLRNSAFPLFCQSTAALFGFMLFVGLYSWMTAPTTASPQSSSSAIVRVAR
jgi:hypothetical protein